jgi:hypothetical protein
MRNMDVICIPAGTSPFDFRFDLIVTFVNPCAPVEKPLRRKIDLLLPLRGMISSLEQRL